MSLLRISLCAVLAMVVMVTGNAQTNPVKRISEYNQATNAAYADDLILNVKTNGGAGYSTARISVQSFADARINSLLVFEGDSRFATNNGISTNNLPALLSSNFLYGFRHRFLNFAKSGDTVSNMVTQYQTNGQSLTLTNDQPAYYFLFAGINDLATGFSSNSVINNLSNLWRSAQADRYKVVAFTIPPNYSWPATTNVMTNTLAVNAWIKAQSNRWDYLVEPSAVVTNTDTADNLHFTDLAQVKLANLIFQVVFGKNGQGIFYPDGNFNGTLLNTKQAYFSGPGGSYQRFSIGQSTQSDADRAPALYTYNSQLALVIGSAGWQVNDNTYSKALLNLDSNLLSSTVPFTNCGVTVNAGGSYTPIRLGTNSPAGFPAIYGYNNVMALKYGTAGLQFNDASNTMALATATTNLFNFSTSVSITNGNLTITNGILTFASNGPYNTLIIGKTNAPGGTFSNTAATIYNDAYGKATFTGGAGLQFIAGNQATPGVTMTSNLVQMLSPVQVYTLGNQSGLGNVTTNQPGAGVGTTNFFSVTPNLAGDLDGQISVVTAGAPANGTNFLTYTFWQAMSNAPSVTLTPASSDATEVHQYIYVKTTTTNFSLFTRAGTALTAAKSNSWFYHIMR